MKSLRDGWTDLPDVVVSGVIGPRGDGYVAGERPQLGEAADYHRGQVESFAEAGADLVEALTMTTPQEAAGIVRTGQDHLKAVFTKTLTSSRRELPAMSGGR